MMAWITARGSVSSYWLMFIGLVLLLFFERGSSLAQGPIRPVDKLRVFDIDEPELRNPAGIGYSPQANLFFVIQSPSAPQTKIFSMTPYEEVLDSVSINVSLASPLNMAFDPHGNRLLLLESSSQALVAVEAEPDGSLDGSAPALISYPFGALGLSEPLGLAVDPGNGALFILEAAARQIVRIQPDGQGNLAGQAALAEGRVTRIELDQVGAGALRGLAFHPTNEQLYVLNVDQERLYEVSLTGQVGASYDMASVGPGQPQGFLLAPSGDATDDPGIINLFITNNSSSAQVGDAFELYLPLIVKGQGGQSQVSQGPVVQAEADFGQLIEVSLDPDPPVSISAVTDPATLVKSTATSAYNPPSPDPSGIAYLPNANQLLIGDGEVDEMSIFKGANVFRVNLSGSLASAVTAPAAYTNEPTGVAYNPANNQVFFSDDTGKVWIYQVKPGPNGSLFNSDDIITSLTKAMYGNLTVDSEGIAFDTHQGHLFIVDGAGREVWEINPGTNRVFDGLPPGGNDVLTHFDVSRLNIDDPEGIEFNPDNGHLYVLSSENGLIAETTRSGSLIRYISTASINMVKPAGLAYGPGSANSSSRRLYIVDRGVDNGSNRNENDGRLYEISFPQTSSSNLPPVVEAGANQTITLPSSASLNGTVSDDGKPNPPGAVTTTWSKVSGPGTVTFGNASAVDTTASFSAAGSYVLRLTANDSALSANDEVTITANGLPSSGLIFADGFEGGNLSAWTASTIDGGDLSVSTAAAMVGSRGLQAVLDDNGAIYVTDDKPTAEARYQASFYFDPNSIPMTSGDSHYLFYGYAGTSPVVVRVQFRQASGVYQLKGALLNDASSWIQGSWFTISDAPHFIELAWQAATAAGANNGSLVLRVDDVQRANLTGVDNDTRRIDRVRLGAVGGIDTGTRGTYYFDAFESRR